MACASSTSAVRRGAEILASSSNRWPCRSAVRTSIRCRQHPLGLCRLTLLGELLSLIEVGQRFDQRFEFAIHDLIELMQGQPDAMIGDAILRKIVGSDLLASIAAAHHAAPFRPDFVLLLLELHVIESRAQLTQGLGIILDLRFFVLAGDHQARWQVCEANSGVGRVDALAAWAG